MKLPLLFLLAFAYSFGILAQTQPRDICASSIDYDKLQKYNASLFNYLKELDRKAAEYTRHDHE